MADLASFRRIVCDVLSEYAAVPYLNAGVEKEVLFDESRDRYLLVSLGWDKNKRVHHCVIHIDIIGDKVWVQKDNTDVAVARELERRGIPTTAIVLGFQDPALRPFTEYAVA